MHVCLNVCMQVRTFVGVSVYVKVYDSITHWLSCMFIYPCKKLCPLVPGYRVSNATRSLKSRPSKFQLSGKQPDDITDLYIFFQTCRIVNVSSIPREIEMSRGPMR